MKFVRPVARHIYVAREKNEVILEVMIPNEQIFF
jgi:hypothetical protein